MAVTGAIFNSLIYGGIDSADYGIYITGEAVYNAPERTVDLVSVPGRNGALAIDQGHFENIEIEYPAGCFADDQTAFATAISDFRNAIMSQLGYQRLTDTYHPDEYRMALYISGIEVSPVRRDNGYAGEFTIKFNAKPQRWLTSGEDPVSVTSGDEITNPTLFEASPVLQIWGYGKFGINGTELEIVSRPLGKIKVADESKSYVGTATTIFADQYANNGDVISGYLSSSPLIDGRCMAAFYFTIDCGSDSIKAVQASAQSAWSKQANWNGSKIWITLYYLSNEYYGSSDTDSLTSTVTVTLSDNSTKTFNLTGAVAYNGSDTITATQTVGTLPTGYTSENPMVRVCELWLNSTQSAIGSPIYFDLEIGEAYKIENGEVVSVNNAVTIPGDLPTLTTGTNTFTYDNTITQFEVVPRWWKI